MRFRRVPRSREFAATAGVGRLVAVHVVGNDASARVMRKLGMAFDRESAEIVFGRPVHVYAIDLTGRREAVHRKAAPRKGRRPG